MILAASAGVERFSSQRLEHTASPNLILCCHWVSVRQGEHTSVFFRTKAKFSGWE